MDLLQRGQQLQTLATVGEERRRVGAPFSPRSTLDVPAQSSQQCRAYWHAYWHASRSSHRISHSCSLLEL